MKRTDNIVSILELDKVSLKREMERMAVHPGGISIMLPKTEFRVVKVKDIPVISANIIKQDMLAIGGEVATNWGTIDHSAKRTDVLICGTKAQFKRLTEKLKGQYFGLHQLALDINSAMNGYSSGPAKLKVKGREFNWSKRTYIMGILNVTPDSFSDGGEFFDINDAIARAKKMISEGADIIDIGGESTRPGAKPVSTKEEISRVVPVIKKLSKLTRTIISIDTTKALVAEAAIKAGALMINDISGLRFDPKMAITAAKYKVPVILMHIKGKPRTMQKRPKYDDLMCEIIYYLKNSINLAIKAGIPGNMLIVDPGFGFGKDVEHNLDILKRLKEIKVLGCPILIGTSRKSTIGKILDLPPNDRLEGSEATAAVAIVNGANILRVHDVMQISRVAKVCDSVYKR
jgi:dihydropteroate synthase